MAEAAPKTKLEAYLKKLRHQDFILSRPNIYVGSIEEHTQTLWVYENNEMVRRPVTYVPGLYKIFEEILVNTFNHKQRDPSMDSVKVAINEEQNCISVWNNGSGLPVEIHKELGVYVPELMLGHILKRDSKYYDTINKTAGGHGIGAKLTNIFSTEFVIETADGKRQKKYKQVFSNNMGEKSDPVIMKCNDDENWTKVSFKPDLAKFDMTHLEYDILAMMRKRVIDLAGCFGKTVMVELNGKQVPVKSFLDYVGMYLKYASKNRPNDLPRIAEKVERWEVCVSLSNQFQQVSFVNGVATIEGGAHVDYITEQITSYITEKINAENEGANVKTFHLKKHLWVFINVVIDNPAFNSTTKVALLNVQRGFGSKCELSQEFLEKVAKSGVVERFVSLQRFKQHLKSDTAVRGYRIFGIPKLQDAYYAGGRDSHKCTLILTEGDSSAALADAGISKVGTKYHGVFSMGCKFLDVMEASQKQIMENTQIQHIMKILGLQHEMVDATIDSLRYGHLMIMADQASNGKRTLSVYSMSEYELWRESLRGSDWSIKFYKDEDGKTSKEKEDWLRRFEPGTYLHPECKVIKYDDNFVDWRFKEFSETVLHRSIPSMVDGLKPSQRKILFSSFKYNFHKDVTVEELSDYASEHSAYDHSEMSPSSTIIRMAQDYVGANNISLLQPKGQFGTRLKGGKDHDDRQCIYTRPSPITPFLFPEHDNSLLAYIEEDGKSIEPCWYMPIIPMVLVNGSEGIGTGWSSYIPNYNPIEIVSNLRHLLLGDPMVPMKPWYKGFRGDIDIRTTEEGELCYIVSGLIKEVSETTVRIEELPIRKWTLKYKEFLESIKTGNDNSKDPFIQDFKDHSDDTTVDFEVFLTKENLDKAREEGLLKKFKLTTTISLRNMNLFDSEGMLKKYDSPHQILQEFYPLRLDFYKKRKKSMLENLELELLKLQNQVRYITLFAEGKMSAINKSNEDRIVDMQEKGFRAIGKTTKTPEAAADYAYLLDLPFSVFTEEGFKQICESRNTLKKKIEDLKEETPESMWFKDLEQFVDKVAGEVNPTKKRHRDESEGIPMEPTV
ncbi:DNA topoisomerase 2-like isoform X2 [Cornus florida]|uniref:DNA topoisomerase 2-like isoform X2 n=1 Tax=Cornus florida TaxID=4283 RepID=UPI0028A1C0A6|nr:DNA topoisomerase 2-like isoform X2 [Cornus florida]